MLSDDELDEEDNFVSVMAVARNAVGKSSSKLALIYMRSQCDDRLKRRLPAPTALCVQQAWAMLAGNCIAKSIAGALCRILFCMWSA